MSSANGPVLECSGLRKSFGDLVAVDDVGFDIAAGETYGLLGPNGAGKTTSISMIAGLLEMDAGSAVCRQGGHDVQRRRQGRHRPGPPGPRHLSRSDRPREPPVLRPALLAGGLDARVDEVLEIVGLTDRADDRAKEYSGGMKRRLNIGIGLLHRPSLLILDEPTVGVDPQSRNAILDSVERLGDAGMAVLYTTHYMEEAERLCDRVGHHRRGAHHRRGNPARPGGHGRPARPGGARRHRRPGRRRPAARTLPGVGEVTVHEGAIDVLADDAGSLLPELLRVVAGAGANVTGVEVVEPDLEAVFLHLTGKALRD